MQNKKFLKIALASIGVLALAGCSEIVAQPTDYNKELITINDSTYGKNVYNNVLSVVYDAIHDGNIGSDVLDKVLDEFSISIIGKYADLKEAAISNDQPKMDAFVKAHKAYWTKNTNGERIDDAGKVVSADAPASETESARVVSKYNSLNERIAVAMYEKISGGSYSTRDIFDEAEFLVSLKASLGDVAEPKDDGSNVYKGLLLPSVEPVDVFDHYLHIENYTGEYSYIEKEVVPNIYRNFLTEQYLRDETPSTIGRSYARKVNIISITDNSDNPFAAKYLMDSLLSEIFNGKIAKYEYNKDDALLARFKVYSNAYVGVFDGNSAEYQLLTSSDALKSQFKAKYTGGVVDPANFLYCESTDYGDLYKKYDKITTDPQTTNSTIESDFTNSGLYTKETGKQIKTNTLKLKDHTTTGWFIKNGGLSELPDSIRSRLFHISVANGVKDKVEDQNEAERCKYDASGNVIGWEIPENESNYIARVNGRNYLKVASKVEGDSQFSDILHYDSSSKTYYIIEVQEAVSTTKLNASSESSYYKIWADNTGRIEDVINNVAEIVGESESYSTLATKYFLEKMELEYYDQSVYDYFYSNYPELFE